MDAQAVVQAFNNVDLSKHFHRQYFVSLQGLADAYSGDELVPSQLHGVYVRGRAG